MSDWPKIVNGLVFAETSLQLTRNKAIKAAIDNLNSKAEKANETESKADSESEKAIEDIVNVILAEKKIKRQLHRQ